MGYPFGERQEQHPTFLHPGGLPNDPNPFITRFGLKLPGFITAKIELDDLLELIENPPSQGNILAPEILPTIKHLGRISLHALTGCWELPVFRNGKDTYPNGSSRARYGQMSIKAVEVNGSQAHRVLYTVMRGQIPENKPVLDHLCENKACCWHRHTQAVTVRENNIRIHEANRRSQGEMRLEI
jgi:hypothetical protein